jgi:Flp pilus assembly protein TadB
MRNSDDQQQRPMPERPRSEPEIILPGETDPHPAANSSGMFVFVGPDGKTHRGTVGPFTIILALLAIGLAAGVILLLVFGLLLVWIPVIAVGLAGLLLYGVARGYWRRLWGR